MAFILIITLIIQVKAVENGRSQLPLDHFWRFEKGDMPDANGAGFDDSSWRIVSVPHDWTIEDLTRENGPFDASALGGCDVGYTVGGTGWYRKTFNLDANDTGKIVHLQFGGVYMNSDVWVNGTHVGNRPYGYSTFWFDITPYISFGAQNVVAVEVKNEGKNSRWYSGSGIFRPVRLMITETVHVEHWGVYITTPVVSSSSADVRVRTEVKNESGASETVTLQSTILDSNGVIVGTDSEVFSISSASSHEFDQTIAVSAPNLWSLDSPTLYTMSQDVLVGGEVVDHVETTFGVRSISFDATNGFLLNGEPVLLQGTCMHHDNYMLGSAAPDRAEERRVELTKNAGYNTIRTAHNPPSQAFLEACDRLGVLVIDEAFDMWNYYKWDHVDDYSKYFASWWQADLDSMVLRDRNHASIIMWSIGNEIPEQGTALGIDTADMLATYVRSLDSTRPVTLAANKSGASYDAYFATLDVVGYNYQLGSYTSEHSRVPDRVMLGSESFAKDAFAYWKAVEDYPYVIGDFVWTGFDYLGEASIGWTGYAPDWSTIGPYPWHLAYCGDIDACGYKRPAAYYRDVLWNTGENKVSVFVTSPTPSLPDQYSNWNLQWVYPDIHPSWTWPGYEGTNLDVVVYSACEEVELFLNGQKVGNKKNTSRDTQYKTSWNVSYQPGELRAVGYISDVNVAEWVLQTAGEPAEIRMTADKSTITAEGSSLCYVTVELLDASGNIVYDPNEDKLISFDIEGPGKLAGVGNANPYGTESFQRLQRTTFRGRCVAVLKSTLKTGTITLTASSSGLTPDSVVIETTGGVTGNTAPVANDDSYSIYSGETLDVWLYGVTSNDFDAEADPLTAVLVSDVSNGSLTLNSDGTFEYTPDTGFSGTDSFTYKANDGTDDSNIATATISVECPPMIVNHSFELPGTGKIQTDWGLVPGWSSDYNPEDSGVDYEGHNGLVPVVDDGHWYAFLMGDDPTVWQLANHTIAAGEIFTLTFDAYNCYDGPDVTANLYYYDGAGSRVIVASVTVTGLVQQDENGAVEGTVTFAAGDVPAAIGSKIGIEFDNPRLDSGFPYGSWTAFDNVRLDIKNRSDFNSDSVVNFLDYAELANAWMTGLGHPDYNDIYDLQDNNIIDMSDVGIFSDDWLYLIE
jgi:beta-galactosidase